MTVTVNIRNVGDVTILDAAGRITMGEGATAFHDTFQKVGGSAPKKVLLNLGGISYLDSCGTGELVHAYSLISRNGGTLKLFSPVPRVQGLLKITGLTTLFEVFDTETAALESFH